MVRDLKWLVLLLIGITLMYGLHSLDLDIPTGIKFAGYLIILGVTGEILRKEYGLDGSYGLILLKTQRGLAIIDRIAKRYKYILSFGADVSLVWGFGLYGIYLLYKNLKHDVGYVLRVGIIGLFLLVITVMFISPYIYPLSASVITGVNLHKNTQTMISTLEDSPILSNIMHGLMTFILIGFGLVGHTLLSLIMFGIIVVYNVILILLGANVEPVEPGGTLLLPGVNLPLIEGIIALIILLVVHETSHGLLSRIAKVKLLSGGIVVFGFVPVGAFIEPDEDELKHRKDIERTRVMVAGPGANLYTMMIGFLILIAFLNLTTNYRETGVFVVGGNLPEGAKILEINNITITPENIHNLSFAPNQQVIIKTDKGEFTRITDDEGKIGFYYTVYDKHSIIPKYSNIWLTFIFRTLALVIILNFLVGVINLIPVPGLDGYHILEINLKNKILMKTITYLTIISFVLAFLPWLFK